MLLIVLAAHAESWDPGATIDPALTADVTPGGFNAVSGLIPALLPPEIAIDTVGADEGYYAYEFANGKVNIQVTAASIVPGNGVLDITADLLVGVNDSSNPFSLYYSLIWFIEDTCPGYVDAFDAHVSTSMALEVVTGSDGINTLDATIGAIDVTYGLEDTDIHMDCTIDDVDEVLSYFGLSIYGLIIDQMDSYLQGAIGDIGPTLETTIEDAFSSASIEQDLDLNGAVAHLKLQPSDVQVTPAGMRVVMSGAMSADPATCIAQYDTGGSKKTQSTVPEIAEHPSGIPDDFHVGVNIGDDFANEALYALWRGGLLCYTLDENGPFPLSTGLLDGIANGEISKVVPESKPVTLVTRPEVAPTVDYTGTHDIGVQIERLGLDFYTEVDGREARLVGMNLDGDAGADLGFDPTTGSLGIEVALESGALAPSVVYNEIVPAANEPLISGFGTLFDTVVGSVVGGLLEDLAFALPSFSGIGLTSIQIAANGDNQDWLGAYANVGPVTYGSGSSCGGCGGDTGGTGMADTAGSSGCGGGCATVPTAPLGFLGFASALIFRRRR